MDEYLVFQKSWIFEKIYHFKIIKGHILFQESKDFGTDVWKEQPEDPYSEREELIEIFKANFDDDFADVFRYTKFHQVLGSSMGCDLNISLLKEGFRVKIKNLDFKIRFGEIETLNPLQFTKKYGADYSMFSDLLILDTYIRKHRIKEGMCFLDNL